MDMDMNKNIPAAPPWRYATVDSSPSRHRPSSLRWPFRRASCLCRPPSRPEIKLRVGFEERRVMRARVDDFSTKIGRALIGVGVTRVVV